MLKVSLPAPPNIRSLSFALEPPPLSVSSPVPPNMMSPSAEPVMESLPPRPKMIEPSTAVLLTVLFRAP